MSKSRETSDAKTWSSEGFPNACNLTISHKSVRGPCYMRGVNRLLFCGRVAVPKDPIRALEWRCEVHSALRLMIEFPRGDNPAIPHLADRISKISPKPL